MRAGLGAAAAGNRSFRGRGRGRALEAGRAEPAHCSNDVTVTQLSAFGWCAWVRDLLLPPPTALRLAGCAPVRASQIYQPVPT